MKVNIKEIQDSAKRMIATTANEKNDHDTATTLQDFLNVTNLENILTLCDALMEAKEVLEHNIDWDCGDNSCYFAKNKTGMRTNGGCRCECFVKPRDAIRTIRKQLHSLASIKSKVEFGDE